MLESTKTNGLDSLKEGEGKRKLVTIQKVKGVKEHSNADRLELANVLGWQVVVKKGEFKEGDLGVYFEIDSFLPKDERYSFLKDLRNNVLNGVGYKLKTARLRGEISQGLLLPLDKFPELEGYKVNDDVTKVLGVKKWYEPEFDTGIGKTIGNFPLHLASVTDEERIQSIPEYINDFKGLPYYETIKYDGSSVSVIKNNGEIKITTRKKVIKQDDTSLLYLTLKKKGILDRLKEYDGDIVLQGEFYGEKIQGNKLNIRGNDWAVFTIEENHNRLGLLETIEKVKLLGLDMVDIEEIGGLSDSEKLLIEDYIKDGVINVGRIKDETFDKTIKDLLEESKGFYKGTENHREGLVVRPVHNTDNKKLSFKVINNDFL